MNENPTRDFFKMFNRRNFFEKKKKKKKKKILFVLFKINFNFDLSKIHLTNFIKVFEKNISHLTLLFQSLTHA
jgi:hypothetical protein